MTPEMTAAPTDAKGEKLVPLPVWVQRYGLRYDTALNAIYRGRLAAKRVGARWYVFDVPDEDGGES